MTPAITITPHPEGSLIDVWVVPRARRTETAGSHDGALRVRVAAPPAAGRATAAAGRLLRAVTGARRVYLHSGAASRRKQFVVVGVDPDELKARLG